MKTSEPIVLFENPKGVRILRKDYKNRSKIEVRDKNDFLHMIYRMPNIPFYEHPLLSWKNLDQCNGWNHDEEYLRTAVQKGHKLVAEFTIDIKLEKCTRDFSEQSYEIAREKIHAQCENLNSDRETVCLNTHIFPNNNVSVMTPTKKELMGNMPGCSLYNDSIIWNFLVIRKGKLSDFFSVDEIVQAYQNNGISVDRNILCQYFDLDMTDLFTNKVDMVGSTEWDGEKMPYTYKAILTGLGFGYPIESTASLLNGY